MYICYKCHQPITPKSTMDRIGDSSLFHINHSEEDGLFPGCPRTQKPILSNLTAAMAEGFQPEFCRTHYSKHIKGYRA